jgi:hypothetical protein
LRSTGWFAPAGDVTLLLPVKQSVAFMQQLQSSPELQQRIKGVLFDDTGELSGCSWVALVVVQLFSCLHLKTALSAQYVPSLFPSLLFPHAVITLSSPTCHHFSEVYG